MGRDIQIHTTLFCRWNMYIYDGEASGRGLRKNRKRTKNKRRRKKKIEERKENNGNNDNQHRAYNLDRKRTRQSTPQIIRMQMGDDQTPG